MEENRPYFLIRGLALAAVTVFLVVALSGPLWVAWLIHAGEYHQARQEYTQAIALYQDALSLRPSWSLPHLHMGQIYLIWGEYELAAQEFSEARSLDPEEVGALFGLGLAASGLGEEDEAIEWWEEALALNPRNAEARYRLGMAYLNRSQWAKARSELERAAQLGNEEARYYLALLLAREDRALAISHLEKVSSEKAAEVLTLLGELTGPHASTRLGFLYLEEGLLSLAREELVRAVALEPGEGMARSYLGYVLWKSGDYEGAGEVLGEAIRLHPQEALNHYFFGLLHRSLGNPEAALLELEKALRLDPENAAFCAEMARTYEEERDYLAAREWYREAAERAPQEIDFHLLRAQFHLQHLLWLEEGLSATQAAVALDPQNGVAQDLLGWAYWLLGQPEEARGHLQRALESEPGLASAYYHLGVIYAQGGGEEEARWAYGRAIDLDSTGFYRERARRALADLER